MAEVHNQVVSSETHWEMAAKTRMGKYLTDVETSFIQSSINLSGATAVMDVGAEAGRFSLLPRTEDAEKVSLDIDSYSLKRLKHKTKKIDTIQADARKIPFKDETFDVIFMIEVLDYIPELDLTFAECYRVLRPEATLIASFGNKSSLKSKIREFRGKSYQHSYRRVTQTLVKSGFKIKKKMGYNWLLFGRTSQNPLIPTIARLERLIGLRRVPSLSPWVIIHAVKPK